MGSILLPGRLAGLARGPRPPRPWPDFRRRLKHLSTRCRRVLAARQDCRSVWANLAAAIQDLDISHKARLPAMQPTGQHRGPVPSLARRLRRGTERLGSGGHRWPSRSHWIYQPLPGEADAGQSPGCPGGYQQGRRAPARKYRTRTSAVAICAWKWATWPGALVDFERCIELNPSNELAISTGHASSWR